MTNHYGVELRCPECNGPHTSCFFNTTGTAIKCQNKLSIYPTPCDSVGRYAFLTYHHGDERFGEIIGRVSWDDPFGEKPIPPIIFKPKMKTLDSFMEGSS